MAIEAKTDVSKRKRLSAKVLAWPGSEESRCHGLGGRSPRFALKDQLEPEHISALADAFLEHVYAVFCDGFAEATPYPR